MKIYLAHSREMDYRNDLYLPLRSESYFENHELILPHEIERPVNTREFYRTIDVFIAECSYPATGLGIEMGWVYDDGKEIYCVYKKGAKISSAISAVTDRFYEYSNSKELVTIIKDIVENNVI